MTNPIPTSQYTSNKEKIQQMIKKINGYIESISDKGEDTFEKIKASIESTWYTGLESYHSILADVYSKSESGNADLKELEHTLKSISAKAKEVGIELGMKLKKKISNL